MRSYFPPLALILVFFGLTKSCPSQNLRDTTLQADYVILCASSCQAPVERLAEFRRDRNHLSVRTAPIESVYAQFHPPAARDSSLREFIRFAMSRWRAPAPRYFLFAGNVNLIPAHKEPGLDYIRQEDSVCVDVWYVETTVDSSSTPACVASLGRLPAWTAAELDTVISKIIAYEQAPSEAWMGRALVLADCDSSDVTLFESSAGPLQGKLAQAWPDTMRIDVRINSPHHRPVGDFLGAWSRGTAIVSFVGHGASWRWSQYTYFTAEDVNSLGNGMRLPICILIACSQSYDRRDSASIVARLLLEPRGGAVATVAGTGLTYLTNDVDFTNSVLAGICADSTLSLGEAFRRARNLVDYPGLWDLTRRYTLLGDPALIPRRMDRLTALAGAPGLPGDYRLYQNYPNPFNPSTTIRYSLPHRSRVSLIVFNTLGQKVAELVDGEMDPGEHLVQFTAGNLASGVYFYQLRMGGQLQTRRLVLLK